MGEINIRFRMNLKTGMKDIVVEYDSDEDMMRHEHEKRHREIVKQLVGEGLLNEDEVGQIKVERVRGQIEPSQPNSEPEQPEAEATGHGS